MAKEYDRTRVDLTDQEHTIAKEFNELFAALVKGEGDKVKEITDVVVLTPGFLSMTNEQRREVLFKVLLANVADELVQHFETGAVDPV